MLAIVTAAAIVLGSHVRSEDPIIDAVLHDGLRRSAVIGRLVEVIDGSNVIVYLTQGDCPRPAVACLMVSSSGPDVRYLRINFSVRNELGKPGGWHQDDLAVAIAHELQHAVEIAGWPDVVDGVTMQAAYARRGLNRGGGHLDTDAAIQAGDDRRAELRSSRR